MPPLVALGIAAGVAGGAAQIYGAHKQSQATSEANATQKASNDAAIAEQKRQDEQTQKNFDATQAAQKAQWDAEQQIRAPYRAAGVSALSKLGDLLGTHFDAPSAPTQPQASAPPTNGAPAPTGSTGPVDGSPASISAYFKSRGVADSETPYWVKEWPNLVARGQQLNDPSYPMKRLAAADIFGGASGAPSTAVNRPFVSHPDMVPTLGVGNAFAPPTAPVVPFSSLMRSA